MTATEHRWLAAPGDGGQGGDRGAAPVLDAAVSDDPGAPIIELSGEIDLHTRHVLQDALREVDGDSPVVIDLTDVTFMDSAGLQVLLSTRRRAPVTIRGARPFLHRVFELAGLDSLFRFDDPPPDEAGEPPHR